MKIKEKLKGLFKREEKKEGKVPEGLWLLVSYSNNIQSKCGRRPKVIFKMKGEKAIGKEMFSKAKIEEYEDRFPIAYDQTPPCSEDVNEYTTFGTMKWEERRLTEEVV